jgi:hypothetical protein
MTPQEKDLIENLEANGFTETAMRLRKFIAAQDRDANADVLITPPDYPDVEYPFNPDDYKAKPRLTPEQALYAYDQAIAYRDTFSSRHSEPDPLDMAEEGPWRAVPCDLRHARAKTDETLNQAASILRKYSRSHRFILSSGEERAEAAGGATSDLSKSPKPASA